MESLVVGMMHIKHFFKKSGMYSLVYFCLSSLAFMAHAELAKKIEWDDLIPQTEKAEAKDALSTAINHNGSAAQQSTSLASTATNKLLNGQFVKLAGYMVPLDGSDDKITEFLLVPYFGACVHVPPPPVNQIVYVNYPEGVDPDIIYDPVWIIGPIGAEKVGTEMAVSGYSMAATSVKPYTQSQ